MGTFALTLVPTRPPIPPPPPPTLHPRAVFFSSHRNDDLNACQYSQTNNVQRSPLPRQGDRYIQGDCYIQINFAENIRQLKMLGSCPVTAMSGRAVIYRF